MNLTTAARWLFWNLFLQDPKDPDPGDLCPGPSGNVTQYRINFQTESSIKTFVVNSTMCKARTCNYTFEPPSDPPSSYDRVSVAAENVVGVGKARNLTTQPISEWGSSWCIQWILRSITWNVHMCNVNKHWILAWLHYLYHCIAGNIHGRKLSQILRFCG